MTGQVPNPSMVNDMQYGSSQVAAINADMQRMLREAQGVSTQQQQQQQQQQQFNQLQEQFRQQQQQQQQMQQLSALTQVRNPLLLLSFNYPHWLNMLYVLNSTASSCSNNELTCTPRLPAYSSNTSSNNNSHPPRNNRCNSCSSYSNNSSSKACQATP